MNKNPYYKNAIDDTAREITTWPSFIIQMTDIKFDKLATRSRFGESLLHLLEHCKIGQIGSESFKELANKNQMSERQFANIVYGRANITVNVLAKIVSSLGYEVDLRFRIKPKYKEFENE